jgi:Fic family protein
MELQILLSQIESLKKEIDELRPLSSELERRIMQKFRLDWNYHSNHIEGNSLTYGETKTFLLHGLTSKGKPLKDHLDIKGHNEALLMLDDIVKEARPITENFIRGLHKMILQENYKSKSQTPDGQVVWREIKVGQYKTQPNHVETQTGEMFYFASPEETPAKMHDLLEWYREISEKEEIHPVFVAAIFHYKFISIHPFDDGNGRVARILMNLILMQKGYLPTIIKTTKKNEYLSALQQADGGEQGEFVNYIAEQLIDSLNLYLRGAKGENINEMMDIDKEIELFKTSLGGVEEPLWLNVEIAKTTYKNIISPLIDLTFSKLAHFDDLFTEKSLEINLSSTPYQMNSRMIKFNNKNKLKSYLEDTLSQVKQKQRIPLQIETSYDLSKFKKSPKKMGFSASFEIWFKEADFLEITSIFSAIKSEDDDVMPIIKIPYNNLELSEDDKISIVNFMVHNVMDFIKKNVNN